MRILLIYICSLTFSMATNIDNVSMLKAFIKSEYKKNFPEINIQSVSIVVRNALDIYNIEILNKGINNNKNASGYVNISYKYNNKIQQENIKYILQASITLYLVNENISAKSNLSDKNIYSKIEDFSSLYGIPATKSEILGSSAKVYMPVNSIIYKNRLAKRVLVAKDSAVKIIFNEWGIEAMSMGKALENGTSGDIIKIENTESKRTITAKVIKEGIARVE